MGMLLQGVQRLAGIWTDDALYHDLSTSPRPMLMLHGNAEDGKSDHRSPYKGS